MQGVDMTKQPNYVLWDGECGICAHLAAFTRRSDRKQMFQVMPYQQAPSPPMTPDIQKACQTSMHVITSDGMVLRAGRASLYVMQHTGWGWIAKMLSLPPFIWGVEAAYWLFARNRRWISRILFPRSNSCPR